MASVLDKLVQDKSSTGGSVLDGLVANKQVESSNKIASDILATNQLSRPAWMPSPEDTAIEANPLLDPINLIAGPAGFAKSGGLKLAAKIGLSEVPAMLAGSILEAEEEKGTVPKYTGLVASVATGITTFGFLEKLSKRAPEVARAVTRSVVPDAVVKQREAITKQIRHVKPKVKRLVALEEQKQLLRGIDKAAPQLRSSIRTKKGLIAKAQDEVSELKGKLSQTDVTPNVNQVKKQIGEKEKLIKSLQPTREEKLISKVDDIQREQDELLDNIGLLYEKGDSTTLDRIIGDLKLEIGKLSRKTKIVTRKSPHQQIGKGKTTVEDLNKLVVDLEAKRRSLFLSENIFESVDDISRATNTHIEAADLVAKKFGSGSHVGRIATEAKDTYKGGRTLLDDVVLQSSKDAVSKHGSAGKKIYNAMERVEEESVLDMSNKLFHVESALKKLSRREQSNFIKVMDGRAEPLNETIRKIVDVERKDLNEVLKVANDLGIKTGYLRNYWPREYDWSKILSLKGKNEVINKMVKIKEGGRLKYPDRSRAEKALEEWLVAGRERISGHLKKRSLDFDEALPKVEDPVEVLAGYYKEIYRNIWEVKEFGKRDINVNKWIREIGEEFGIDSRNRVEDIFKREVGAKIAHMAESEKKWLNVVKTGTVLTKMTLSQILQLGQPVNAMFRTNLSSTLKGIHKLFTKEGREFADRSGAALETWLMEIMSEGRWSSRLSKGFLNANGMIPLDRMARQLSSNIGRQYAAENFSKLQRAVSKSGIFKAMPKMLRNNRIRQYKKNLEELGVDTKDALKKRILSDRNLRRAGLRVSNETQFQVRPKDLPRFWSSPNAKMFTLLRSFAFNQAKFMKDNIKRTLIENKNPWPLLTMSLAYPMVGKFQKGLREAVIMGVAEMTGQPYKGSPEFFLDFGNWNNFVDDYLEGMAYSPGFGLMTDSVKALQYGERGILKFMAGPPLSTATEGLYAVYESVQQKELERFTEWLKGEAPVIGRFQQKKERVTTKGGRELVRPKPLEFNIPPKRKKSTRRRKKRTSEDLVNMLKNLQ